MTIFQMARPRGFRLDAATTFLSGFVPGSGMAAADANGDRLTLAFRLDRTFEAVAVSMREDGERLVGEVAGTGDVAAAERQVSRILGLEADADAWAAVGDRDPVVGRLKRSFPGFFTVAKPSPYDAAVWSIIAPRMNMRQAANVKLAIARALGDRVTVGGREHHVFPHPGVLAELASFEGLSDEKVLRLRGVAVAALEGRLDVDHLRVVGEHAALRELQTLRGIGPWAASHVYYRGAAPTDALPTAEPRVLRGLGEAYAIPSPSSATFQRIAEDWRPFRMWVCVLLSRHLARVGKWNAAGIAEERAIAGRALARAVASR